MALDITGLGTYVSNNGKEYAMKSVASATTAKALIDSKNVQFGMKSSGAILKLSSDVVLAAGGTCGARTAGTTLSLSNKNLDVKPIQDNLNICVGTMYNTFYADSIAKGMTPTEELLPAFADAIMNDRAAKIAAANEALIWLGDLSLTGTTNLKYINGIAVQVTASTSTATGSTIINKLQNFFLACDAAVRSQDDFRICVSQAIYAEYRVALANANIYQPVEDMTVFGTTAKFLVTSGLNTSRKIFGLRLSNLQLGLDGESDGDTASMFYSIETKNFYSDFTYKLGVAVIWNESTEALYATV